MFDLQADPIAGVVCEDDAGASDSADGPDSAGGLDGGLDAGRPFAGWMELTRAIERALADARRSAVGNPLARGPAASGPDPASL